MYSVIDIFPLYDSLLYELSSFLALSAISLSGESDCLLFFDSALISLGPNALLRSDCLYFRNNGLFGVGCVCCVPTNLFLVSFDSGNHFALSRWNSAFSAESIIPVVGRLVCVHVYPMFRPYDIALSCRSAPSIPSGAISSNCAIMSMVDIVSSIIPSSSILPRVGVTCDLFGPSLSLLFITGVFFAPFCY